MAVRKSSKRKALTCKLPGCKKPHHAQGYCQDCYDNLRKKKKVNAVKSNTIDKKHAPATKQKDGKNNHAPAAAPAAKAAPAAVAVKVKGKRGRPAANPDTARSLSGDEPKAGRLGLIKTRHEAMKREIDQIREDLESEEEE
jgi:hypothetical protein